MPLAVRQLPVKVEQIVIGRVAVELAAQHQHRRHDLCRVDDRQVRRHVDIGAGGNRIAELRFFGDDRFRHRRVVALRETVAREDRADHAGVAFAARIGAQRVEIFAAASDFLGAIAFIGESRQRQPAYALGGRLREGRGANAPRRRAVEIGLLLSGFFRYHRHRGFEILDAAGDVGTVARRTRIAVAVVIHGPDVVTGTRQHVHEGVFAFARNREVIGRARRIRRAVHHEDDGAGRLAPTRRADALAPQIELHILATLAFVRPIFGAPHVTGGFGRRRRHDAGQKAGAQTRGLEHRAARHGKAQVLLFILVGFAHGTCSLGELYGSAAPCRVAGYLYGSLAGRWGRGQSTRVKIRVLLLDENRQGDRVLGGARGAARSHSRGPSQGFKGRSRTRRDRLPEG